MQIRYKEKLYSSAFKISRNFKKKLIWIHVASIGEYKSIIPVIDKLNRDYQFLITSVTLSSANIISKDVSEKKNIIHRFFPIDKKSLVEKFLTGWKPNMAIFVDSEIWPNFLLELKKKKIPLGIVTGIRGSFRYRDAICKGEYLHSGATPFDYRKDSVVAVSMLINEMNIFWQNQLKKNKDLVITFGQFFTNKKEHSFAKSSGLVNFCIDVRSNSNKILEFVNKTLIKKIKLIEKNTNTKFSLGDQTNSQPALMDKKLIKIFHMFGVPDFQMLGAGATGTTRTLRSQNEPSRGIDAETSFCLAF